MKKIILLMAVTWSFFASAQGVITPVDQIREKQAVEMPSATRIRVQDETSKIGGWILKTSLDPAFVKLDEGNGIGIVVKDRTADNYGNVGLRAVDLGTADNSVNQYGATATNATVGGGLNNRATGQSSTTAGGVSNYSSAFAATISGGSSNISSGSSSTVGGGSSNTASGGSSVVSGGDGNTVSSLVGTISGGRGLSVATYGEWAGGFYNTLSSGTATSLVSTDRLFSIGNGTSGVRSDAISILKNGLARLPSVTNALITAADGKAILTKEWYVANSTGSETLHQTLGFGNTTTLGAEFQKSTDPLNISVFVSGALFRWKNLTEDRRFQINNDTEFSMTYEVAGQTTKLLFETPTTNNNILFRNGGGTVAYLTDIGSAITNTSQLVNDGNGGTPFATLDDIPVQTSQLVNDGPDGLNPYLTAADLPAAYTNEMAQDAVGNNFDSTLTYNDGAPSFGRAAITGDVAISAGSNTASYNNVVPSNKGGAGTLNGVLQANGSGTVSVKTVDTAPTNGSTNLVDSNGVFDAIAATGTVTSVTGTNGVTVATGTSTPVIGLGNITPSSVQTPGNIFGGSYGSDFSVSDAELLYINSLTSNAQTQLNSKTTGAASSTDNAIARFDGTTGKIIQDSGITIDDNGGITLAGQASPTYGAGKIVYDTTNNCFTLYNADSNVALQAGQEMWIPVRNVSGSTIPNGSAVYINGSDSGLPTIALAQANSATTTICAGLTTESIANNSNGFVTSMGLVRNLDTSSFAIGNIYLSSSVAGGLTQTAPSSPNYRYRVGFVTAVNASTGAITVTPTTAQLGNGTALQVLGINSGGTSQEYQSTNGTGNIVRQTAIDAKANAPTFYILASNDVNSTTTDDDIDGLTFTLAPGKTAEADLIGAYGTAATTTGLGLTWQVANPSGADGSISGVYLFNVQVNGQTQTNGNNIVAGSIVSVAANTTTDYTILTAQRATGNNSMSGKLVVKNNSTNQTATVKVRYKSEIAASDATISAGTTLTVRIN